MQSVSRRNILIAAALPAMAAPGAGAAWLRHDLVVYCDPTLHPLLDRLGGRFGAVRVFAAPPRQMVALLAHGTQDDVLITLAPAMDEAVAAGLAGQGRRRIWANRLVIAGGRSPAVAPAAFSRDGLMRALGSGRLALPDPSDASAVDGAAVLTRLGVADGLRGRLAGAANTAGVAFLLREGAASIGLCHATDVAADPSLHEVMPVPQEGYEPILYDVALSKTAWSSRTRAFLDFLASDPARGLARDAGLQVAS